MKSMTLPMMALACVLAGSAFASDGQGSSGEGQHGPHHPPGPPAEFLSACKGQSVGAKAQVKSPRGDTLTGTCQLMFVPDHMPGGQGGHGGDMPPPPQQ